MKLHIPLEFWTETGWWTFLDTGFAEPPLLDRIIKQIDTSKYHSPIGYLEIVLPESGHSGTIKLQYYTGGAWTDVSGASISFTTTDYNRKRSSAFAIPSGVFDYRVVANADLTEAHVSAVRVIIKDEATTISKTEVQHDIGYPVQVSVTDWCVHGAQYYHEDSKMDGKTVYFEATMSQTKTSGSGASKTASCCLWDMSAMAPVDGSIITTTSETPVRVRSGAISLNETTTYCFAAKHATAGYWAQTRGQAIIFVQSNMTKTRLYYRLGNAEEVKGGTLSISMHQRFASADFDGYNVGMMWEATIDETAGGGGGHPKIPYTAYARLYRSGNYVTEVHIHHEEEVGFKRKRTTVSSPADGEYSQDIYDDEVNHWAAQKVGWYILDLDTTPQPSAMIISGDGLTWITS